jgi:hypothetical protein
MSGWAYSTLPRAAATLSSASVTAAATAVGVPDVVLNISTSDTTALSLPASAAGVAKAVLQVRKVVAAVAVVPPVVQKLIPLPTLAATAVGAPTVSPVTVTAESPVSTDRADWLAEILALLQDILDRQSGMLEVVHEAANVAAGLQQVEAVRNDLYAVNHPLKRADRLELARSLSRLRHGLANSAILLADFTDTFGDNLQGVSDDVHAIQELLEDIPDPDPDPGGPTTVTTFLALAATSTGVPGVTTATIVAPPTTHLLTQAATARGAANVATSVIRVPPGVSNYAVTAPATSLGVPNVITTFIPRAPTILTRNFAASARGVPLLSSNTTRATATKPIWVHMPNSLSDAVMLRYNARRTTTVYVDYVSDVNRDGIWDGRTTQGSLGYNNLVNHSSIINAANIGALVALDWEGAANSSYVPTASGGTANFVLAMAGFWNGTDPTIQSRAISEMNRALTAWNTDRPGILWGVYGMPWLISQSNQLNPGATLLAEPTTAAALWTHPHLEAVTPDAYITFKEGTVTDFGQGRPGTITRSDMIRTRQNQATIGIRCADAGGGKPYFPFVSRLYYNTAASPNFDSTLAPLEWCYQHIYHICNYVVNGRTATGVIAWDRASSPQLTETQLKVIYQGVNGLPYDPNMARP